MRPWSALLLNVVVAGVAIFLYDQLRSTTPGAPEGVADDAAREALAARVAALEAERPVELRGDGGMAAMRREAAALRARMDQIAAEVGFPVAVETSEPAAKPADRPFAGGSAEPTVEELARFRLLQKTARAEAWRTKQGARLDKQLAAADLRLTEKQRDRVLAAQAAFQPRVDTIWTEAKTGAAEQGETVDWAVLIAETTRTIQATFATELESFLSPVEAEAVAAALYPARGK